MVNTGRPPSRPEYDFQVASRPTWGPQTRASAHFSQGQLRNWRRARAGAKNRNPFRFVSNKIRRIRLFPETPFRSSRPTADAGVRPTSIHENSENGPAWGLSNADPTLSA